MKILSRFPILLICILVMSFMACDSDSSESQIGHFVSQPTFVEADPVKGFNYGYYYYIPQSIRNASRFFLLVQPNNSGGRANYSIDDAQIHAEAAASNLLSVRQLADELGVALLVPAIPRPFTPPPFSEPQILNRAAMQTDVGPHVRVDLQLIRMIDDFRLITGEIGINLESKILLHGFSASGAFGNRFTSIHPERVHAVVSGGMSGMPILPIATMEGESLIYPVGIADLQEITGSSFNLSQYRTIPQFIYLGAVDANDPLNSNQYFGNAERQLIISLMGTDKFRRWEVAQEVYAEQGINATFRTYPGVGHTITPLITSEIIIFLRNHIR